MHVVFIVLYKLKVFEDLLVSLYQAGITNGTVIDSYDMMNYINPDDSGFFSNKFGPLLNDPYPESKTMFFIVREEQIEVVHKTLIDVVGNLDTLNVAEIFSFPLSFYAGNK